MAIKLCVGVILLFYFFISPICPTERHGSGPNFLHIYNDPITSNKPMLIQNTATNINDVLNRNKRDLADNTNDNLKNIYTKVSVLKLNEKLRK